MSGAVFILAINLTIAGLFATAFMAVAIYERSYVSARFFAISFAFGMVNFLAEFVVPLTGGVYAVVLIAYCAFLCALVAINLGLARLYKTSTALPAMAVIVVAAVVTQLYTHDMPRDSILRMSLYQAPYFLLQAIGASIVWRARWRGWRDPVLATVLTIAALHYMAKPFIAAATGGAGSGPENYVNTTYAMFSQTLAAVLGVAVALSLLDILLRRMLQEWAEASETDKLSGLFNRRGFENRRDAALNGRAGQTLPVSLVICDLDDFKSVNDTFGHAAGDAAIAAFAEMLRETVGDNHPAARIGGEEFALLLPGCNLATARLFAESARAAFSGMEVEGIPASHRLTASFGVAEYLPDESASDLQRRADEALYAAKRAGKDCVRTAITIDGRPARRGSDHPTVRTA